jgi:hypothetical protein
MSNRSKRLRRGVSGREDPRWSAEDALRIKQQLSDWLRSNEGVKAIYVHLYELYHGSWPASVSDPWHVAEVTARENADLFDTDELIWCDPPMVDLLAAAAEDFPSIAIEPHHLPCPHGIVIFAKPVPAIWDDPTDHSVALHRISALTWGVGQDTEGNAIVSVDGWVRARGQRRHRELGMTVSYRHLQLYTNSMGHFGADPQGAGGIASPSRLLQTLTALLRSPIVTNHAGPAIAPLPRRRRTEAASDQAIRRVYVRRHEYAAAELQAARDERAGRPTRGHWVRGHWKMQWYPSIEENRPIWIGGYPRGDFSAGAISGTKVLLATDRPAEDQVDANEADQGI